MKSTLILLIILAAHSAMADTIVTKIHSYNEDDGFIRLENGQVAFVNNSNKSMLDLAPGTNVKVQLDETNTLHSVEVLADQINLKNLQVFGERPDYTPTVLPTIKAAREMFESFASNFKRVSECSDRAHIWSYDEFKKSGHKSQKVFAFFTASYINRVKAKWWFHVAPLVQVQDGATVKSFVMDYMYTDGPRLIKEWTDMMVFSKRECKMTTKFSEYDVNPQTEDCYMMIDTMYNRLPADLSAQEKNGTYRTTFSEAEIRASRGWAFEAVRSN